MIIIEKEHDVLQINATAFTAKKKNLHKCRHWWQMLSKKKKRVAECVLATDWGIDGEE